MWNWTKRKIIFVNWNYNRTNTYVFLTRKIISFIFSFHFSFLYNNQIIHNCVLFSPRDELECDMGWGQWGGAGGGLGVFFSNPKLFTQKVQRVSYQYREGSTVALHLQQYSRNYSIYIYILYSIPTGINQIIKSVFRALSKRLLV